MKKGFLTILAAMLICMQTVSTYAVSNEDSLQEEADSNSSEITQKENENSELTEKLTKLNKEIENSRLEIATLQQKIDNSNKTVNDLNDDITDNKEKLKERIRAIYMAGTASNLEVILGAKDFDDLINKVEYVSLIADHDSQLIDNLTQDVNVNKKAQKVLKDSMSELEKENKQLTEKREAFLSLLEANSERLNYLYGENQSISDMLLDDPGYGNLQGEIESYYKKNNISSSTKDKNSSSSKNETSSGSNSDSSVITSNGDSSNNNSSNNSSYDEITDNFTPPNETESDDNFVSTNGYIWPVPGFYNLTSLWDEDRGSSNHGALDIASGGIDGASVVSAHSGTVIFAENNCIHNWGKYESCGCGGGYGNYVMLDHGDGYSTVYAHMSSIVVSIGDTIEAGQLLGFVGSTGYSTGAHLHFETRYDGVKYDPLSEYPDIDVTY
ncbi:MAG: peptidoglycan DD-metalloendopeptidase family protein [Acutalibacteraceae bacterium]|nr:peptidoglycan DD-metalloendopeptidase family protein [Acutalibacteraceae bacterium]